MLLLWEVSRRLAVGFSEGLSLEEAVLWLKENPLERIPEGLIPFPGALPRCHQWHLCAVLGPKAT